ncbi:hypothetical protein BR93DRAFT_12596 [Coniochaeta sp. PMI_546]|nr:hypothetical protein BR93DRAFT_12596 [Coniochaeta sp. PMI_546]
MHINATILLSLEPANPPTHSWITTGFINPSLSDVDSTILSTSSSPIHFSRLSKILAHPDPKSLFSRERKRHTVSRTMAPLYQDPSYDYTPYTSPSRTRTRDRNLDRDNPIYSPLDSGLDRVGDYVARRLVPVMLNRSERPVQLVMNFGTLHLGDDGYARRAGAGGGSNAVVYNAPGCVMTMGTGGGDRGMTGVISGLGGRRPSLLGGIEGDGGYGYRYGVTEKKRVAICDGCYKRQLVGLSGYCSDCELGIGTTERIGLDGVRHGYGRMPERRSEWVKGDEREERERERLREMDERLRDLQRARKMRREREMRSSGLGGYFSDYERDELQYATDREGFRYSGERW